MNSHVEQGGRLVEWFFGLLTGATVLGLFHWILGVPAALYYAVKVYRLLRNPKARE